MTSFKFDGWGSEEQIHLIKSPSRQHAAWWSFRCHVRICLSCQSYYEIRQTLSRQFSKEYHTPKVTLIGTFCFPVVSAYTIIAKIQLKHIWLFRAATFSILPKNPENYFTCSIIDLRCVWWFPWWLGPIWSKTSSSISRRSQMLKLVWQAWPQ